MTRMLDDADEILSELKGEVGALSDVESVIQHLLHDMAGKVREEMTLDGARQYHSKYFSGMTHEEIQADVEHSGCAFYEALGSKKWLDKVIREEEPDVQLNNFYPEARQL